ncbi:MAG: riboflavin synthase [Elusimicrobia bacterium]|nr:riboflavin synthase [Elusimicrobiota bacterium]
MFTGIIEDIGKIRKISSGKLSVETKLDDIKIGDSISVNGVCLTVIEVRRSKDFSVIVFDFSPETSSKTNIGKLKIGSKVNLERAVKIGDRLGGHFITGHIETASKIKSIKKEDNSSVFEISLPKELNKYVVNKGSITVDGVSLTIVKSENECFSVSIVPHTMEKTTFNNKKVGDLINIETDMMAKYSEKISNENSKTTLTKEKLYISGFISE